MSLWQKETLNCVLQAFPSAVKMCILDKKRLYLCVMKVCTAHGVLQPRDDEGKSKWAGWLSTVELPFLRAVPELLERVNLN